MKDIRDRFIPGLHWFLHRNLWACLHSNVRPALVELKLADPEFVKLGLEYLCSFITSGLELLNPGSQPGVPASISQCVDRNPTTQIQNFLAPSQNVVILALHLWCYGGELDWLKMGVRCRIHTWIWIFPDFFSGSYLKMKHRCMKACCACAFVTLGQGLKQKCPTSPCNWHVGCLIKCNSLMEEFSGAQYTLSIISRILCACILEGEHSLWHELSAQLMLWELRLWAPSGWKLISKRAQQCKPPALLVHPESVWAWQMNDTQKA